MKKLFLLAVTLVLGIAGLTAKPVDVNTAKDLGQMFVQTKFELTSGADLNLIYTVTSDNGEACVYVFNVGNHGFVLVSATDNVRPILGYSENGTFDTSNPHNGAMYMLETYKNSISYALENNIAATPEIAAEWESLRKYGRLNDKKVGKVGPLVQTRWNQDSPYNLYAPPTQGGHPGAGGRCYAGCVATAMGQLMRYWEHPTTGNGSHSYNCIGYGPTYYNYGIQSADFGATTYHWELMPLTLDGATQEQIEAVATLLYHCGVATDMVFDWDGSGTYSDLVPGAMSSYFDYNYCIKRNRSSYSLSNWIAMLKAEFDLGRPVYYSGQSSEGGHAFVCDGYDENDMMNFNFGWSGSGDGYFAVDAIDYASQAAAIFNFVPTAVHQATAQAPANVTVVKASDVAQEATVSWTNPTKTVMNQNITSIDQMIVTRDGIVIYTVDNPNPGESMSFLDADVPCYSTFEYRVFAVINGVKGTPGVVSESFGPSCEWKVVATSGNMQGWKDGKLVAYDGAGREIASVTMTNNNPANIPINITLGKVSFAWKAGTEAVTLSFKIKDASGEVVYDYPTNSSDNIPAGYFYTCNNNCGNTAPEAPGELFAVQDGDNVVLTWSGSSKENYGYNIYRDGVLIKLVHSTEYVDEAPSLGGHCYTVCTLSDGGESELTNEACATAGDGCEEGHNLWFEMQANNKPIITWEAPENAEGLQGYSVYRKMNDDGQYERVKLLGPDKTEYKETKSLVDGNWYFYRVYADYGDCISAPFKSMGGNEYFVKIYYSVTDVNDALAGKVTVYPNPVNDNLTVEAEGLQSVMIYNTVGQLVYSQVCEGNAANINLSNVESGFYMVKVLCNEGETVRKISVIR